MVIQLSAGQNGPVECQLAVGLLFNSLKKEFPDIIEISKREGRDKNLFHSILFETTNDLSFLEGSIQWICKSPLRKHHKRKNWFVDISIIPEIKTIPKEEDYKIEKFHCGGKGGQNINKVETGIRAIHIPTGITVVCTEERSQFQNKQKALKRIASVITKMENDEKEKQINKAWQESNNLIRGNPVRIYEGVNFKLRK